MQYKSLARPDSEGLELLPPDVESSECVDRAESVGTQYWRLSGTDIPEKLSYTDNL